MLFVAVGSVLFGLCDHLFRSEEITPLHSFHHENLEASPLCGAHATRQVFPQRSGDFGQVRSLRFTTRFGEALPQLDENGYPPVC